LGLANGNHTFEVRARDTDFNIDPSPAVLKFRVKSPFWKQPWFILLIGSLLVITIYQTIGLIKRNEQLERIAEKLKKSNRELKEFAYIGSHDLKEPLRGIVQLTEWTLEDSRNELDKKSKEYLNMLKERTTHMNNMIQDILEYSRIGRIEEKAEKIDLNELVQNIIDLLAPPDNIKIIIENKLPEYTADKTRLTQLFENLISNAMKYIDKPDGIIKIGCMEEENEWKFNISDNGPGIEEKYFEKIFKIFHTLGINQTDKSTGIGLTIVKKIIDLYEGRIWVESEIGKGTTFYFTLPKQHKGYIVK
jgi:light-regulated signal transduction histidine kinase (bacteriophytochrome)